MGQRPAKSDSEKLGKDRTDDQVGPDHAVGRPARWRQADPDWCRPAALWYESLRISGQAVYYQQSDAEQAWVLAEVLSRGLSGVTDEVTTMAEAKQMRTYQASLLRMWLTGSRELLTTESARRGAHVRLDPTVTDADGVDQATEDIMNVIKHGFGELRLA